MVDRDCLSSNGGRTPPFPVVAQQVARSSKPTWRVVCSRRDALIDDETANRYVADPADLDPP
jgi:hypothetical protein